MTWFVSQSPLLLKTVVTEISSRENTVDLSISSHDWRCPALFVVTVWVGLEPICGGFDDVVQVGEPGFPTERLSNFCGVRVENRWVSRTSGTHFDLEVLASDTLQGIDHFLDGKAAPDAQVKELILTRCEMIEGEEMRSGEIFDMNIIADASAVRSVVIVSKNRERIAPPESGFDRQWNDTGFGIVVGAERSVLRTAGNIEVP